MPSEAPKPAGLTSYGLEWDRLDATGNSGLSISYGIVQDHGGTLGGQSERRRQADEHAAYRGVADLEEDDVAILLRGLDQERKAAARKLEHHVTRESRARPGWGPRIRMYSCHRAEVRLCGCAVIIANESGAIPSILPWHC